MNYPMSRADPRIVDVVNDDAAFLYLQYSTHWDSLCHVGQMFDADAGGKPEIVYYNGYRGHELWYLSDLADWLRQQGRSRFFLTAPPLNLPGAVGAPATPIGTV